MSLTIQAFAGPCDDFSLGKTPLGVSIFRGKEVVINDGRKIYRFDGPVLKDDRENLRDVYLVGGVLSPDGLRVAVLVLSRGMYGTSHYVYLYSKRGTLLHMMPVERGDTLYWPTDDPNLLLVTFSESHYHSDWYLDTRLNRNTPTVGTDVIDIKSLKLINTISHSFGWDRYRPASDWPNEKMYAPRFKIFWSKSGRFYADIEGDRVRIYRLDKELLMASFEKTSSLERIRSVQSRTLGLFADDITRFEREIAENFSTAP